MIPSRQEVAVFLGDLMHPERISAIAEGAVGERYLLSLDGPGAERAEPFTE